MNIDLTETSISRATEKIFDKIEEIEAIEAVAAMEKNDFQVFSDVRKDELKSLRRKAMELNEFQADFLELKDEMKKFKENTFPSVMHDLVKDKASMFYSQLDCRKGLHRNSKEFKRMAEALRVVMLWDTTEMKAELQKCSDSPKRIEDALEVLKKEANNYLEAKYKQKRPNPSALRQTRLAMAESILKFAEDGLEQMKILPSRKVAPQQQPAKEATAQKNAPEKVM